MTDGVPGRVERLGARMPLVYGMRFLAAGAIVIYHFTATPVAARYWGTAPEAQFEGFNEVSRYGWLAVQVFFVISGLVIARSAQSGGGLRGFLASRVSRLFPAYWACVLLTVLLRLFWDDRRPGMWEAIVNLTMIQGQVGIPNLQVVFWTLLVELKFYLLVGLLLAFGRLTDKRLLMLSTVWPSVALMAELGLARFPEGALGVALLSASGLLVPQFAACFGLGIVLHLIHGGMRGPAVWAALMLNVGLAVRSTSLSASEASKLQGVEINSWVTTCILLAAIAALAVCMRIAVPSNVGRQLTLVGALTYPLYLVHVEFGYAVIDALSSIGPSVLVMLTAVATALALAVAIHVLVERRTAWPLRRLVERVLEGRQTASAPACQTPEERTDFPAKPLGVHVG